MPCAHILYKYHIRRCLPGCESSPQAHAVTEVNLDQTANAMRMDPCEFRLKNVVHPMDEDPTGGTNLGNARIEECIRKGMEAFFWKEKREHIREKGHKRYAYGVVWHVVPMETVIKVRIRNYKS